MSEAGQHGSDRGSKKVKKSACSRAGEVVSAHFAANVIWSTRKVSKGSIISKKSQLLVRPDTGDQPRGSEWNDFGSAKLSQISGRNSEFCSLPDSGNSFKTAR